MLVYIMKTRTLLAVTAILVIQGALSTENINASQPEALIHDDTGSEKLFHPGVHAAFHRDEEESGQPTQEVVFTTGPARQGEVPHLINADFLHNGTDFFQEVHIVDNTVHDQPWIVLPNRSPWTYAAFFGLGSVFTLLFVAYSIVRYRHSQEKTGYEKVNNSESDDLPLPPLPDELAASEEVTTAEEESNIEAERLVLNPLLGNDFVVNQNNTQRDRERFAKSPQEARGHGRQRSLWSKIVKSSRELVVPGSVSHDSTTAQRGSSRPPSSLPTIASHVDSLRDLADVEKTLWWRSM